MGQNYSYYYYMFGDYNDVKFNQQLCDMNYDPNTGYRFNVGDKVKVTGYYKSYGGKLNINEKHQVNEYNSNDILRDETHHTRYHEIVEDIHDDDVDVDP